MKRKICQLVLPILLAACKGEQAQIGVEEPFRVEEPSGLPQAQFFKGKLPGAPPPTGTGRPTPPPKKDGGETADGGSEAPPHLVDFSIPAGTAYQGEGGVSVNGSATPNAFSVGLELDGVGTGYWVIPVGAIAPEGNRVWSASCDFDASIPTGNHKLLGVAFDQNGNAGQQFAQRICIGSRLPDNLNSCPNSRGHAPFPPDAVIALTWDTEVDLDLQVLTPGGVLVDPKHPLLTELDASAAKSLQGSSGAPPHYDGINRDSNANCNIDGIREEDLVFYNGRPRDNYQIFVNLFAACGQPAVHFRLEIWAAAGLVDGGSRLVRYYPRPEDPQGGELLDISANGGAARGLFVTEFPFH